MQCKQCRHRSDAAFCGFDLGLHSLPLFLLWAAWHKWVKGIKSICISLIFLQDPCFIKVMYKESGLITWLVAIQALNYTLRIIIILQEQQRDRTYLLACAPREGSNQRRKRIDYGCRYYVILKCCLKLSKQHQKTYFRHWQIKIHEKWDTLDRH